MIVVKYVDTYVVLGQDHASSYSRVTVISETPIEGATGMLAFRYKFCFEIHPGMSRSVVISQLMIDRKPDVEGNERICGNRCTYHSLAIPAHGVTGASN